MELEQQIHRCMEEVTKAAEPRLVYRFLPVREGQIQGFPLEGKDMRELLADCQQAVLMAVTLGPQVEQLLMRREVTNMADAVIMDACASTAVENVSDHFEFDLRKQLEQEGKYLTDRFSPGYGDFPLAVQPVLLEVLDAPKRIGLCATDSCLLTPAKSVTALIGLSETEPPKRLRGCATCSMRERCAYRGSCAYGTPPEPIKEDAT